MKVGVVDNLPLGGAKRVVYGQITSLARRHDLLYLTNTLVPEWSLPKEVEVVRYDFETGGRWLPLRNWFRQWRSREIYGHMADKLRRWGADKVVVHPCRVTQAPAILAEKLPMVYYAHEWLRLSYEPKWHPLPEGDFLRIYYEKRWRGKIKKVDLGLVKAADKVLANSKFTAHNLHSAYGVRAKVVYPGVDTQLFKPGAGKAGEHFLFIGERDDYHGYPLLDRAVGSARLQLKVKVVSFKRGRFEYKDRDLVKLYQQSLAVICLDRMEPLGLVPLEAMACGVPVIAVDEGGYRETVVDGVTGRLVRRHQRALLEAMTQILGNQKLRLSFGAAGRARAEAKFNWIKQGSELEANW